LFFIANRHFFIPAIFLLSECHQKAAIFLIVSAKIFNKTKPSALAQIMTGEEATINTKKIKLWQ